METASLATPVTKIEFRKTIFGYTPKETVFSVLHPLARMMIVVVFNIPFLIVNPFLNLIFLVTVLICYKVAKVPKAYLLKFTPFLFILTFFLFLSFAFFPSVWIKPPYQYIIFDFGFTYYYENFIATVTMWVRWMSAIFGVIFVLSIIDERDINIALKSLRFPYFFRFIVATALRCFFTFYYDAMQIIEAQKARGLDLDSMGMLKKAKYYAAVMVPLIMIELKKADEMSDACDSRGYVTTFKSKDYNRTEYVGHNIVLQRHDKAFIVFVIVLLLTVLIANFLPEIGPIIKWIPADPAFWPSLIQRFF